MKFGIDFMPMATIHDYVEMKHNSGQIKIAISTFPTLGLTNTSSPQKKNKKPKNQLFSSISLRTTVQILKVLHDH